MFFINHIELGNETTALIEIKGSIDSDTSEELEKYINSIIDKGIVFLIVDYSEVEYVSSEGIGMILLIQKTISKKDGCIVAFNLSKEVRNLFKLLSFDKLFTIAEGRDEAISILDRHIEMRSGSSPKLSLSDQKNDKKTNPLVTVQEPSKNASSPKQEEHKPTENLTSPKQAQASFPPFIIKCVNCNNAIRIKEKGNHFCPECNARFSVPASGQALFDQVGV